MQLRKERLESELARVSAEYEANYQLILENVDDESLHERERKLNKKSMAIKKKLGILAEDPCSTFDCYSTRPERFCKSFVIKTKEMEDENGVRYIKRWKYCDKLKMDCMVARGRESKIDFK